MLEVEAALSKSKELRGTSGKLQSQWSCSEFEVPEKSGFVEKPRQRSKTAAVVVVVVEGAGGEVSRQPTEEIESQRKPVFFLKNSGLELVSKKKTESAAELVDLGVVEADCVEQPHERTVNELLVALSREVQWAATPNRAVRSDRELPRGSGVYYCSHDSLHDSLTVPRRGIRNATIGDTYSYKWQ